MNRDVKLNLIVSRAIDIDRSTAFYRQLGLAFVKHQHGKGLEHFSADLKGIVFEIYPHTAQTAPTTSTRLGFQLPRLDNQLIEALKACGSNLILPTQPSEWGLRAVVTDPDGHRVELTQIEQI